MHVHLTGRIKNVRLQQLRCTAGQMKEIAKNVDTDSQWHRKSQNSPDPGLWVATFPTIFSSCLWTIHQPEIRTAAPVFQVIHLVGELRHLLLQ